jgi:hypothetical protein
VRYNISVPRDGTTYNGGLAFESKWESQSSKYSVTQHRIGDVDRRQGLRDSTNYYVELTEQSCNPVSVLYDVDISFSRGVRKIEHSQSNVEALLQKADVLDENNTLALTLPPGPQALQEWHQKVVTALPVVNEWAVLDALGELLVGEFYDQSRYSLGDGCPSERNPTYDCVLPATGVPFSTTDTTSKL